MNKKVPLLYYIGKWLLTPIFRWYYHPKVIGKENIIKDGPILLVGNHKHLFDQCLVIIATKRGIHYMAKKEYFDNPKTAWFFKATGCISVDRSKKDQKAKEDAISVLQDGGAVGLFPEGTRNRTDSLLLPFKFGAVSMAQKTGAYLIPFGITGKYRFRSKDLTIHFGNPFQVQNMDIKKANEKLYHEVESLLK